MRTWFRRPSPALVVAVVALIAATGGNAIASGVSAVAARLGKGSVTSREVKDRSLTLKDFKASDRASLKGDPGATGAAGARGATGPAGPTGPQGPAGTPNGYTKDEADAAFLGRSDRAADSDKLDGIDSSGFIQGSGAQAVGHVDMTSSQADTTLASLGSSAHLVAGCSSSGLPSLRVVADTTNVEYMISEEENGSSPMVSSGLISSSGGSGGVNASVGAARWVVTTWKAGVLIGSGTGATATVMTRPGCDYTSLTSTAGKSTSLILLP